MSKEISKEKTNSLLNCPFYSFAELEDTKYCLKRDLKQDLKQKPKKVGPIIGLERVR